MVFDQVKITEDAYGLAKNVLLGIFTVSELV